MWDAKLKVTNEQDKQGARDTPDNSMVGTRGEGGGRVVKGEESQIHVDGRTLDFGW